MSNSKEASSVEDTSARSAMKLALEALRNAVFDEHTADETLDAIKALEEALAKQEQRSVSEHTGEPVTILPDGSAFGVMSFPLPDDHWIYAPNEYRDGEYEPIDLPSPILNHALRDAVVSAIRYAVRGATMLGQETDFDPDALVQNAVYALCGPYTQSPQPKQEQGEPVAFDVWLQECESMTMAVRHGVKFLLMPEESAVRIGTAIQNTTLQQRDSLAEPRTWVGLTDEEHTNIQKQAAYNQFMSASEFAVRCQVLVEAKLKEKNSA
jgi:hypothetical protein